MSMNNAIFIAFDDNYVNYARACLNSLVLNYPGYPQLLIAYNGSRETVKQWLSTIRRTQLVEINIPNTSLQELPRGPVNSTMIYWRYELWNDSFSEFDTILHLDVDLLVLKPLDSLFLYEEFFAVANNCLYDHVRVFHPENKDNPDLQQLLKQDGLCYPDNRNDMINAGVFVLPKIRRTKENYKLLLNFTKRYAKWLAYADQSVISLWMQQCRIKPSYAYQFNLQTALLNDNTVSLKIDDAAILHFSFKKPDEDDFMSWYDARGHAEQIMALYKYYRDVG